MDIARWLIPAASSSGHGASATFPKTVMSLGGRFGYHDQGQTPNTQISVMDYGDTQLIFEVRGLETNGFHGSKVGNIAHLEEGMIVDGKVLSQGGNQAGVALEPGEERGRPAGRAGATSATSSRPCAAARSRT